MADRRCAPVRSLVDGLRIELREQFLDDEPADHAAAFAGACRRLALPGLDGDARDAVEVMLRHLGA